MKVEINISDSNIIQTMKLLSSVLGFKEYVVNVESGSIMVSCTKNCGSDIVTPVRNCEEKCHCEEPIKHDECVVHESDNPITTSTIVPVLTHSVTRSCLVCGKEFESKAHNQNYCSQSCKRKAADEKRKRKRVSSVNTVFKCPECGNDFVKKHVRQIYCSGHCQRQAKVKRLGLKKPILLETRTCPVCNKEFMQKFPDQKYCSHDCRRKFGINRILELRAKKKSEQLAKSISVVSKLSAVDVVATKPKQQIFELKCRLCGSTFKTTCEHQKYCKPCLDSFGEKQCDQLVIEEAQNKQMLEESAKIRFKVCPKCGHTFEAKNPAVDFFCPNCMNLHKSFATTK